MSINELVRRGVVERQPDTYHVATALCLAVVALTGLAAAPAQAG